MLNHGSITIEDLERARALLKTLIAPKDGAVLKSEEFWNRINLSEDLIRYQAYTLNRIRDPKIKKTVNMYYFCGREWNETGISQARSMTEAYITEHAAELNSR